jgi:hypothetical protein
MSLTGCWLDPKKPQTRRQLRPQMRVGGIGDVPL